MDVGLGKFWPATKGSNLFKTMAYDASAFEFDLDQESQLTALVAQWSSSFQLGHGDHGLPQRQAAVICRYLPVMKNGHIVEGVKC